MAKEEVLCYNRGCGKTYNPDENEEDSCSYHPGTPVFHDAYKGWSCCSKKSTDFTEFLNFPGCKKSFHSNVKPPELEKPNVDKTKAKEVVVVQAPVPSRLPRPSVDAPLIKLKPTVAQSLAKQLEGLHVKSSNGNNNEQGNEPEIAVGTSCKNGGCKVEYQGNLADHGPCIHHPGSAIFHEGLKFWSCCTKRTTDFAAFLEQIGCTSGNHRWVEDRETRLKPVCRYDWHQTGKDVIVSIYAKKYSPEKSTVEVNPVRIKVYLYFPEEDVSFDLDSELRGIISVDECSLNMLSTKVEVKLRKAEPGSWSSLIIPKPVSKPEPQPEIKATPAQEDIDDSPVDLGDL